jgi:hypothetical protein
MELLKVFVGDGTNTGTTVATMVKGDLLILNASDKTPYTSGSDDIVVAACTDKGVIYSTPIKKANVVYTSYVTASSATEATATAAVGAADLTASTTYSIGVQIKEDLRMGTYNKNTEIIGSYTTPASVVAPGDGFFKMEMASTIAKGFAANPLTSAGSPYQLVNVFRQVFATSLTGVTAAGQNLTVTKGSRIVTFTGSLHIGLVAGVAINLGDSSYLVEKVESGKITLDTAFQGTSATVTSGTGSTAAAYYTATLPDTFTFEFDGIAQTQKNRYDQFRMVDFVVITPKGNDAGLITVSATAPTLPVGSYRQVRDLEEKAYTNATPLINYREFPFEDFALNADSTKSYDIFTITYNAGWGYNLLQSSQNSFPQTLVVCAPRVNAGQFDVSGTSPSGSSFAEDMTTWYGTFSSGAFT